MRKWISEAAAGVLCLLGISALIFMFGVTQHNWPRYLPSPSYATGELFTLFWVSLAASVILSAVWLGPGVVKAYRRRPHEPHNEDLAALGTALFGWLMTYIFFIGTGPLILTYVVGTKQVFTYTIQGVPTNSRRCSWAIEFEDLPMWNYRLCSVPDDIRDQLSRCDKVTVEGVGTRFGLRVQNLVAVHPSDLEDRISSFEDCPA